MNHKITIVFFTIFFQFILKTSDQSATTQNIAHLKGSFTVTTTKGTFQHQDHTQELSTDTDTILLQLRQNFSQDTTMNQFSDRMNPNAACFIPRQYQRHYHYAPTNHLPSLLPMPRSLHVDADTQFIGSLPLEKAVIRRMNEHLLSNIQAYNLKRKFPTLAAYHAWAKNKIDTEGSPYQEDYFQN
jgi:hypothetical protein